MSGLKEFNRIYEHDALKPWPIPDKSVLGLELNPAYIEMANRRLQKELGMFL
jgi:hypothetical protein